MTILFSPVGTADPLTQQGEAALLHICRHYRPATVVLFLSPDMAQHENDDHRYTRALDLLQGDLPGWEPKVQRIDDDGDVHRFDALIPRFRDLLSGLADSDGGILLNVSSGTPQMQAALLAIHSFGLFPTRALQVTTPREGTNRPEDRERPESYPLEDLWELNPDHTVPDAPNRVIEVDTPHMDTLIRIENIRRLVTNYDYEAAVSLLKTTDMSPTAGSLIVGARDRLNLDRNAAARAFGGTPEAIRPQGLESKLYEYIQTLEVRLKRHQYGDFVRAITPAITEILYATLDNIGVPKTAYLDNKGHWDRQRINSTPWIQTCLADHFSRSKSPYPFDLNLLRMVQEIDPSNPALASLEKLICFESGNRANVQGVRNLAAHEIIKITASEVEKYGGMPAKAALTMLARIAGVSLGLYDRINELILKALDEMPLDSMPK